jgi:hypothetical protein
MNDGNFLPLPAEKVILFSDYKYHKGAIRIYNLPGTFVPKGRVDS